MLLLRIEAHLMIRQPYPRSVKLDPTLCDKSMQRCAEGRPRQARITLKAQALDAYALKIWIVLVKGGKYFRQAGSERLPALSFERKKCRARGKTHESEFAGNVRHAAERQG